MLTKSVVRVWVVKNSFGRSLSLKSEIPDLHGGRVEYCSKPSRLTRGRADSAWGRVESCRKIHPTSISEHKEAIFCQIEARDSWGNIKRLESNPANTLLIPKSSRSPIRVIWRFQILSRYEVSKLREDGFANEIIIMRMMRMFIEKDLWNVSVAVIGEGM
ncbi:hypothetical protein L2E82_09908 [Cichorium intybus]|uniref:Uncharacterized protein n=2 Tax=Cichorium intybus TaxID=13427 RepID=A0ACB9GAE3_CICIN|nr:hypothetical protein L2E82_09907 [Cichorium intybus]KAI3780047.1 hypothetical protein L2E82_09908 [Cichorium intybus]